MSDVTTRLCDVCGTPVDQAAGQAVRLKVQLQARPGVAGDFEYVPFDVCARCKPTSVDRVVQMARQLQMGRARADEKKLTMASGDNSVELGSSEEAGQEMRPPSDPPADLGPGQPMVG